MAGISLITSAWGHLSLYIMDTFSPSLLHSPILNPDFKPQAKPAPEDTFNFRDRYRTDRIYSTSTVFYGNVKNIYPWFPGGKLIRFLWQVMLVVGCKILEIGPESWFVNNPIPDPSRQSDLRYELITAALDLVLKTANMENCINILISMEWFSYVFLPSLSLRSICLDLMKIFWTCYIPPCHIVKVSCCWK